jgi:hypothetical protein
LENRHISNLSGGIVLLFCTILLPSLHGSDGNATIALSDMAKLQTMLALFHIWAIDLIPHCLPGDTFNVPTAHPQQAVSLRGRRVDNKPKKKRKKKEFDVAAV